MSRKRQSIYWACQVVGWFAAAATNLLFGTARNDLGAPLWRFALTFGIGSALAIGWTHAYRAVIRRRRWLGLGLARLVPRVVAACVVLGFVMTASATPAWVAILHVDITPLSRWAPQAVVSWISATLAWSVIYLGVHYFERWRQAELEKLQLVIVAQDAQLQGLMAQVHPHFLFNCLNSVRALVVEDPARAQTTVTALSRLMRHSLQAGKDTTVPLATEIDMVRTYLELEAVRFEERLTSDIDVAADTAALHVPAMLVQSLVENGVKHGIERSPDGGTIRVAAWREDGALRVRVTNPGRIAARNDSTQIGLANARARLRLLYGDGATLALHEGRGTVTADVAIPLGPLGPLAEDA